jgi:hypothetical protein
MDPTLEKMTGSGAGPDVGMATATAVGGWLPPVHRILRILLTPNVPPMSEYPRST